MTRTDSSPLAPWLSPAGQHLFPEVGVELTPQASRLLKYHRFLCKRFGKAYCFPGLPRMCNHLALCERQVRVYLAELVRAGLLRVAHRGNRHARYYPRMEQETAEQTAGQTAEQTAGQTAGYKEYLENRKGEGRESPTPQKLPLSKNRERDDPLFQAVCEVTATDPSVPAAAESAAQVCAGLRSADPPYSPEEVRRFGTMVKGWKNFTGPPGLGVLERGIGQIRAEGDQRATVSSSQNERKILEAMAEREREEGYFRRLQMERKSRKEATCKETA